MSEMDAIRKKLITVAKDYAETLKLRPNVVGLVLYGSLARGGLTQFSDVDIMAIYESKLPDYWAEHRLVNSIKVDILFARFDKMKDLAIHIPYNLYERGGEGQFFLLESLLLGDTDTILFDPAGEIARVKQKLNQLTSYQKLAIPTASDQFHWTARNTLSKVHELLQKGDLNGAIEKAKFAAEEFKLVLRILTSSKDLKNISERLNIPELYTTFSQLKQIDSPGRDEVGAIWQGVKTLWDYSIKRAYEPIKEELTRGGVKEPKKLELIGNYQLFWPGHRLHELDRVVTDMNLSLKWSSFELERGNFTEALGLLWRCQNSKAIIELWKWIDIALKNVGYDVSNIVQQLFDDAEFKRLAEQLDNVNQNQGFRHSAVSPSVAELAVSLAQKLRALLEKACPLMSPLEIYSYNASFANGTVDLAHALAMLEEIYAERGELDKFISYSEARKRTISAISAIEENTNSVTHLSGLKPLQHWYLKTEPIEKPSGEPVIFDKDAKWRWRDPKGDSTHVFLSDGSIEICMKSYCDLHGKETTAPALFLELTGDFTVETNVIGTGGILVWKDEKHYLNLKRHRYLKDEVRFEVTLEDNRHNGEVIPFVIGRGKLKAERLYLRLNRNGSWFSAWCSKDATEWFGCGDILIKMNDPLLVGVFGLSLRYGSEPMKTQFGALKVWLNK